MAVVAIAVGGLVVWLWQSRPASVEEVAQPIQQSAAPRNVAPPSDTQSAAIPPADTDPFAAGSSAATRPVPDARRDSLGAFAAGDYASARDFYQRAVDKNPNDADAHSSLGQALGRLGQVDEAVKHFERAVSIAPDKWAYRANLAHALGAAEKWDRAVAEYREAVKLFPADSATQYNLALSLYKKGDAAAEALRFY